MGKHFVSLLRDDKEITVQVIAYFHLAITGKNYLIYGSQLDDDDSMVDIYATEVVLGDHRYYLNKVEDIESNLMKVVVKALIMNAAFENELEEYGYVPKEFDEIDQYEIEQTGCQKIIMEEKTYQNLLKNDELLIHPEIERKQETKKTKKWIKYVLLIGGIIVVVLLVVWFLLYKNLI